MDLLKDITRELRGGDDESGSADGGQSRTTTTARADSGRRDATEGAADRTQTPPESTGGDSSGDQLGDSSADRLGNSADRLGNSADRRGDSTDRTGTPSEQAEETSGQHAESADSSPEEVHLCSFCETEFDASNSVCPECDAEIVMRGDR